MHRSYFAIEMYLLFDCAEEKQKGGVGGWGGKSQEKGLNFLFFFPFLILLFQ